MRVECRAYPPGFQRDLADGEAWRGQGIAASKKNAEFFEEAPNSNEGRGGIQGCQHRIGPLRTIA